MWWVATWCVLQLTRTCKWTGLIRCRDRLLVQSGSRQVFPISGVLMMIATVTKWPGRVMALLLGVVLSVVAQADTRVLETAYGQVKVNGQPKRVVALSEGAVDTTVALGVTPVGALATRGTDGLARYMERSEERRVGKEWRGVGVAEQERIRARGRGV